jgi:hypothetical protein
VPPSSPIAPLSGGAINGSDDTIQVELIAPDGMPPAVRITWPPRPTVVQPARFADTASASCESSHEPMWS